MQKLNYIKLVPLYASHQKWGEEIDRHNRQVVAWYSEIIDLDMIIGHRILNKLNLNPINKRHFNCIYLFVTTFTSINLIACVRERE